MFELNYAIEDAQPRLHAAAPAITFAVRITSTVPGQWIHNVLLESQIQIESTRRRYQAQEQQRLGDLFGSPDRWSETLRTMLWMHASVMVPPFEGETVVDLHVPCTFDFNVAATKYFHGLEDGDVPLAFLFSGSIFYAAENGSLNVARIAWEKEAKYRLPVGVWQAMMNHYYPNAAWLSLHRRVFNRLDEYKRREGLPTWEHALEKLLDQEARRSEPATEPATEPKAPLR